MFRAASVSGFGGDSLGVGKDLGSELLDALGEVPDIVLLFCAPAYDAAAVIAGLYARLGPELRVFGCSSCAEITSDEALSGSASAMGLCLGGDLEAALVQASDPAHNSEAVGRRLGEALVDFDPALVVLLVDGIHLNSTPLLAGIQAILGAERPIVGGVAADDLQFTHTEEYLDHEVLHGAAVALALRGPLRISTVVASGWEAIGRTRVITATADNKTITTLDDEPALGVYRHYLGTHGRDLDNAGLEFPIGIVALPGDPENVASPEIFIRAVQGAANDGQGVRVSGDIALGARVRMMRASHDALIAAARDGVAAALARLPAPPAFALFFDCAGRKVVLGPRYRDELAAAFTELPPGLPKLGFFTYGELAPRLRQTIHHDETFTAVLVALDNSLP